ncbi:hypothetical protein TNCV_47871 [Trichonephila clavipes]|nr:hypothetical protein TNCV_47871 [Trichonephila clavipes]
MFVKRRPWECLQPNFLRSKHTGPTPGIMVWIVTSYDRRRTLVVILDTLRKNVYIICPVTIQMKDLSQTEQQALTTTLPQPCNLSGIKQNNRH